MGGCLGSVDLAAPTILQCQGSNTKHTIYLRLIVKFVIVFRKGQQ